MRRYASVCIAFAAAGLLTGCTGAGVFFDHTALGVTGNPNTPAGNSEMFQRIRGEPVAVTPLVPETGNVWPGPQKPDRTLQELEHEQGGGPAAVPSNDGTDHRQPRPANGPQGPAPAVVRPGAAPSLGSQVPTPNGSSVDVTGGQTVPGYRELQPPASPPQGKGIMVPNGNGTSTLIGPDGSIKHGADNATQMIHVLYFAWLRERAGRDEERLDLPPGVATVGALAAWLRARDAAGEAAFAQRAAIRAAVNHSFAPPETPIADGDEVAFFPPVTGG